MASFNFSSFVEQQLTFIKQPELLAFANSLRISPRMELRDWDYDKNVQQFNCWISFEDNSSNFSIGYCENGFGPTYPWGLLDISEKKLGQDSAWFVSLEDALRNFPGWHGKNPENYEIG